MVWYKFRHGNESVISWVEFKKVHDGGGVGSVCVMDLLASVMLQ